MLISLVIAVSSQQHQPWFRGSNFEAPNAERRTRSEKLDALFLQKVERWASRREVTVCPRQVTSGDDTGRKHWGSDAVEWARRLMWRMSVARNQRGALTQAGAGIAASRRKSSDFARPFVSLAERPSSALETSTSDPWESIMSRFLARATAVAALAALVSGCALTTRHSTVQELKYNPGATTIERSPSTGS